MTEINRSQYTIGILEILQWKHKKVLQGLSPSILNEVFVERNCNNKLSSWFSKPVKSELGKIWYRISFIFSSKNLGYFSKGKNYSEKLNTFKATIKKWVLKESSCILYKTYFPLVRFISKTKINKILPYELYQWISRPQLVF